MHDRWLLACVLRPPPSQQALSHQAPLAPSALSHTSDPAQRLRPASTLRWCATRALRLSLCTQAIFALHRGDVAGARNQLDHARRLARAVLREDVAAFPTLRQQPTVKAMLEELAEAALFDAWLGGLSTSEGAVQLSTDGRAPPLLLLGDDALMGNELQPTEYLGGVCDLVGEIGRFAVRRATERDAAAVRLALSSASAVQAAVLALGHAAPRTMHKKLDALRTSVRKLETLLYELSLVERSGRVRAEPIEPPPEHPITAATSAAVEDA